MLTDDCVPRYKSARSALVAPATALPALVVIPSEIASMLALTLAASAFAPPTLAPRPASAVRAAEPLMVAKQNFGPIKNPGSGVSVAATEYLFPLNRRFL